MADFGPPRADSLHCILAQEVLAPQPHPPFAASVKDGYAVLSERVHWFLADMTCSLSCSPAGSDGTGERNVMAPVAAGDYVSVTNRDDLLFQTCNRVEDCLQIQCSCLKYRI